jgi:Glycoside-hydrolase family GH114
MGVATMTGKRTHGLAAALLACVTGAAPVAVLVVAGASAAQAATAHAGGTAASSAAAVSAVSAGSAGASFSAWQPAADTNWMWELGKPLNTANANLMGTGVTAWNGDTPPGDNPALYDIDAIENPSSTVAQLHQLGDHAICYIEVGSAGNYYTAAQEGIPTTYYAQLKAAGDLGKKLSGYPEYFININAASAVSIIESMIQQQCAAKGFDGVETDLDETFGNNEGKTGFTITLAEEESYLTTLANYMHGLGLAWIAKNLDDTANASFVDDMEPLAQGIISEQCNQYGTCSYLSPFETDGKWIGNAEYAPETQAEFCASDNAANINGILFNVNLSGGRKPCR